MMLFQKAKRENVKLKLAITGPSGSGKTMSAILLAKGLCPEGKIAVIDTENRSASLYEDHPYLTGIEYLTADIVPPYTTKKYLDIIEDAIKNNFDVLVIDSISHAWAGEGGLLDKKSGIDSRGGNSYTNWASITKEHEQLKAKILSAPLHIIVTMRSKQDYVVETNDKGKPAPKKVGLAPIQREGIEYEFTTVFDVGMDHQYCVSKDRTGLFDGRIEKITQKTGEEIAAWLKRAPTPVPIKTEHSEVDQHCDSLLSAYSANDKNGGLAAYKNIREDLKRDVWSKMTPEFKSWFKEAMG